MTRKIIARDVNNETPTNYDITLWVDRHRLEGAEEAAGEVGLFDLFLIAEYNNVTAPALPDVGWEIMDYDHDFFGAGQHKYLRSGVVVTPSSEPTPGTFWRQLTIEGYTRQTNTPIPYLELAEADFPTDSDRIAEVIERAAAEFGLPGVWDTSSAIGGPFITFEADSVTPFPAKTVYEILEQTAVDIGQESDENYPVPKRFWYISGEWISPFSPMTSGILRVLHYYSGAEVAREPVPLTDRSDGMADYLYDTFDFIEGQIAPGGDLNGRAADTGQKWASLVGSWTEAGDGHLKLLTHVGQDIVVANAGTADGEISSLFAEVDTTQALAFRVTSHPEEAYKWEGFVITVIGDSYALKKYEDGSFTTIATYSGTPADNDEVMAKLAGSTIRVYINGVLKGTHTNSFNQTAVLFGLQASAVNTARWDNLEVWARGAQYNKLTWPKDASGMTNIMAIQGPGADPAPVVWEDDSTISGANDGDLTKTLQPDLWQASHTYLTGAIVRSTTLDGGHYVLEGAGGNSGGTEPTWNTTEEATTSDNGLTWRRRTYDAGSISTQVITDDGGEVTAYVEQVPKTKDGFDRDDNIVTLGETPDGKQWEYFGTNVVAGIRNGRAYFRSGTGALYAVVDHKVSTCIIEAPFTVGGVGQRLVFRFRDINNLWYLERQSGSYKVYKREGGSDSPQGTYTVTPVNGDILKISMEDNVIKVYRNGSGPVMTITHAFNMGATRHGIGTSGNLTVEFDYLDVWQTYANMGFGIGDDETVKRLADIGFGWAIDAPTRMARPSELGTLVGSAVSYAVGDSFKVHVRTVVVPGMIPLNEVRYFHNGISVFVSSQHPEVTEDAPFFVQGAILHEGATISNVTLKRFTYGIYSEPDSVSEFGPWPANTTLVREELSTDRMRRAYKDAFFSRHAWPQSPVQADTLYEYHEGRLVLLNNRKFGWRNRLILITSVQPSWSDSLLKPLYNLVLGNSLKEWGDEEPAGFMLKNNLNDRAVPPKPTGIGEQQGERDGRYTVNHKFFWDKPRSNERFVDIELKPVGGQAWQPRRFSATRGEGVVEGLQPTLSMTARFRAVSWSGVPSDWTTAIEFTTAALIRPSQPVITDIDVVQHGQLFTATVSFSHAGMAGGADIFYRIGDIVRRVHVDAQASPAHGDIQNLEEGIEVEVRVVVYDQWGMPSVQSDPESFTPEPVPLGPATDLVVGDAYPISPTNVEVPLTWNDAVDMTGIFGWEIHIEPDDILTEARVYRVGLVNTSVAMLVTSMGAFHAWLQAVDEFGAASDVESTHEAGTTVPTVLEPPFRNADFEYPDRTNPAMAKYWHQNLADPGGILDYSVSFSGYKSMKLEGGYFEGVVHQGLPDLTAPNSSQWALTFMAKAEVAGDDLSVRIISCEANGVGIDAQITIVADLTTGWVHRQVLVNTSVTGTPGFYIRFGGGASGHALWVDGPVRIGPIDTLAQPTQDGLMPAADKEWIDAAKAELLIAMQSVGDEVSLVDRARMAPGWRNLGALTSNAFREATIAYYAGNYYVFYTGVYETERTDVRVASTLEGIVSATPTTNIVPLKYPTVVYDETTGIWHLWGLRTTGGVVTKHYTSSSPTSGWTYSDDLDDTVIIDTGVAKHPTNGYWYAIGFTNPPGASTPLTLMRASVPEGPWTDLGNVFGDTGFPPFAADGRPDPNLCFVGGRDYILFSGRPATQLGSGYYPSICEIDLATGRVKGTPVALIDEREAWMVGNQSIVNFGISDLAFLRVPGQPDRLFAWANDGGNSSNWSWGTLEIPRVVVPSDGRRSDDFVRLDMSRGVDRATGIRGTLRSGATWTPDGLVIASSGGGAHGYLPQAVAGDVTCITEFTPLGVQGAVAIITSLIGADYDVGPCLQIDLNLNEIRGVIQGSDDVATVLTSGVTVVSGTRYTVVVRKSGTVFSMWVNGVLVDTDTHASAITDFQLWSIGGQKTLTQAARYPFVGTVHSFVAVGSSLPLSSVKTFPGTNALAGTVTSVGMTMPSEFSVSGSPITGAGTVAVTKANQSPNTVYAGPVSGGTAAPTFRALVAADLPSSSFVVLAQVHEHIYQEDHTFELNAAKTNFITAQEFEPETTEVYKNGLLLRPGAGFDYTEDTTYDAITLASAPSALDKLLVAYIAA